MASELRSGRAIAREICDEWTVQAAQSDEDPSFDSSHWSPDGCRSLLSDRDDADEDGFSDTDIFMIDPDGSGLINLTNGPADRRTLHWSPNSRWLLFVQKGEDYHNCELYRINVNSSNVVQLTNDEYMNGGEAWSPNGWRIAFSYGSEGPSEIQLMNVDGSGRIRLTNAFEEPFNDAHTPAWSPDSRQIAFESDRDGYYGIYIMNVDGSNVISLTDGTPGDWFPRQSPRWSPDGTQIAFAGGDVGDIYLINVNDVLQETGDAEPINLTNHPADDGSFVWQP
jgi:TolB protein